MVGAARSLGAALALVLLSGCERAPTVIEVPDETVMVHAILEVGADSALVHVATARLDARAQHGIAVDPARDVRGELRGAGIEGVLEEAPPHMRCIALRDDHAPTAGSGEPPATRAADGEEGCYLVRFPEPIRAGETYEMRATLADGRVVEGVVDMPHPPKIVHPAPTTVVPVERTPFGYAGVETMQLAWKAGEGTAWINIAARVTSAIIEGQAMEPGECRFLGTGRMEAAPGEGSAPFSLVVAGCERTDAAGQVARPDSIHADLLVIAHDSIYQRAMHTQWAGSLRQTDASIGLRGAVGFFSGEAAARQPIVLVPIEECDDCPAPSASVGRPSEPPLQAAVGIPHRP